MAHALAQQRSQWRLLLAAELASSGFPFQSGRRYLLCMNTTMTTRSPEVPTDAGAGTGCREGGLPAGSSAACPEVRKV